MSTKNYEVGLLIKAQADLRALEKTIGQIKEAGGDVSKLEKQAKMLTKTLSQIGKEQSAINHFKKMEKQLEETNAELAELEKREKEVSLGWGGNYSQLINKKEKLKNKQKELNEALRKTSRELDSYNINIKKLGDAEQRLARQTHKVNKEIDALNQKAGKKLKLTKNLEDARKSASGLGSTLFKLSGIIGTVFAVGGITSFFKNAIGGAANLEEQLDKVQAVSGATNDQMAKIAETAKHLGSTTRYTATEAAEGFEILARAGLDANQQIATIPSVLALAQGQSIGMAESAQFVGDAVTIMGGSFTEAGRYADVLAKGASQASTTVPQLANAISYAGQYAKEAGFDIEGLVGILDVLAQSGLRGERAGTALKNIFAQLQDPASKAAKELAALGIETDSLSGVINGLKAAGEDGKAAINAFGVEAGPALRALLSGGTQALDEYIQSLRNAEGAAQKAATQMDSNLKGAFRGLGSAWDSVKTTLGEPILKPITEQINRLADVFRQKDFLKEIQKLGKYFAQTFGDMAKSVVDFVKNFTLDDTTNKVNDFSDNLINRFNKVGASFSLVYNVLGGAFNGARAAITGVASVVTAAVAEMSQGMADFVAKIPGMGEAAKALQTHAGAMKAVAKAYRDDAKQAWADSSKNIDKIAESFFVLTGATEKNTKAVKKNAQATKDSAAAKQAELDALNQKRQRLAELKDIESAYASQAVKNYEREAEIKAEITQLEGEIAEAVKDKTLTEIEGSQKVVEAKQKVVKATKEEKNAVESVGLSLEELATGITASEQKMINSMSSAIQYIDKTAKSTKEAGEMIERYLVAGAEKIKTPEGLKSFIANVEKLKIETQKLFDDGKLSAEAYNERIKLLDGSIESMKDRVNELTPAWKELGDAIKKATDHQQLQQFADQAKKAFDEGKLSAEQYKERLEQINTVKRDLLINNQKAAESDKKSTKTTQEKTEATKAETAATKENTEATKENAEAAEGASSIAEAIAAINQANRDALSESATALEHYNRVMDAHKGLLTTIPAALAYMSDAYQGGQKILEQYREHVGLVDEAIERLNGDLTETGLTMKDVNDAALLATSGMEELDEVRLSKLNDSIEKARQRLLDLKQQAKDTAAELEAELASLKGDDSLARELEQKKKLAELEKKLAAARARNSAEEIAAYEKAIQYQKQIFEAEQKKYEAEKQRENERKRQQSSGGNRQGNDSGGSITVELGGGELADAVKRIPRPNIKIDSSKATNELAGIIRERDSWIIKTAAKESEANIVKQMRTVMKGQGR